MNVSTPQFTHIDHVSIIITDVERSRRFYGGLLGLREIAKPSTFDFVVVWYDLGNQHLHLLLKDRADTRSPRHFALRVPDIRAARDWFHDRGVPTEETHRFREPTAFSFSTRTTTASRSFSGCGPMIPFAAEQGNTIRAPRGSPVAG
jgi:catechol 2,3-dioxygenase-like lactoylglutathione lyase family enzyme